MKDPVNKKLSTRHSHLFTNKIDQFCNQLNSIVLAVELLKNYSSHWKEPEKRYFNCLATTVTKLADLVRNSPDFIGINEDELGEYLDNFGLAWWIEIFATSPHATYYFGPFITAQEAERSQFGYIEDLENEGSQILTVQIQQCQPSLLTIVENESGENSQSANI